MTVELSAPSPEEVEPRLLLGAKDPLRIRDGLHQVRPAPLSASRYWSLRSPYDDTIATRAHATRTSTARPIPRPAHLLQMQQSSLTVVDAAKHYPSIADALNASQTIQKAKRDSGHTDQSSHSVRARLHGLCHFHAAIPACLPAFAIPHASPLPPRTCLPLTSLELTTRHTTPSNTAISATMNTRNARTEVLHRATVRHRH